jgi:hypothetical protein
MTLQPVARLERVEDKEFPDQRECGALEPANRLRLRPVHRVPGHQAGARHPSRDGVAPRDDRADAAPIRKPHCYSTTLAVFVWETHIDDSR